MSAFSPSIHWRWQFDQVASLSVPGHLHQTPFLVSQLSGLEHTEFSLEQAQLFDAYWQALASLKLSEQACFAAATDAVCCQQFMRQTGHKSWAFTVVNCDFQPQTADLVFIHGQQCMLALVVQTFAGSSQLLLLEPGFNLQDKALTPGQVLVLLNNRLQPIQLNQASNRHLLAKSA